MDLMNELNIKTQQLETSIKKLRETGTEYAQAEKDYKVLKNPKFEVYTDKSGEFRFRLKATNGQIIAVGEGYKSKKSLDNGIASVKKNAVDAKIVEE